MGKVYNVVGTNKIVVEDTGGRIVWATDRQPVNLLPESNWISTNRNVEFPDFVKFANYAHQRVSNPAAIGNPPWALSGSGDSCQTVTMIQPEDSTFSDVFLGSVPAGVNYIDVRVKVRRTKDPTYLLDQYIPQLVAYDQWIHLPGGSCLVEASSIWRRLFDVILSGQNIFLRRKQSVAPVPGDAVSRYGGIYQNSGSNQDAWLTFTYQSWGWVTGPGGAFVGSQRNGHPAALIQVQEFGPNNGATTPTMGAKHPTRERACSVDVSQHNFSSTYNVDIVIRPGYIP